MDGCMKILVADTTENIRCSLRRIIHKLGFDCYLASTASSAVSFMKSSRPHIVLMEDMLLRDTAVSQLSHWLKPYPVFILLTDDGGSPGAQAYPDVPVFDYLCKPVAPDRVEAVITRARCYKLAEARKNLEMYERLENCVRRRALNRPAALAAPSHSDGQGFDDIVGNSPVMQMIFQKILRLAQSDANIMIYGESGTGKELIARSLHRHSRRKDKAFIPVDCGALPETLLESELFGYEKGAFTGAVSVRKGLIEYANGGTLFLDEIVELAPNLQAKLLRVLQENEFRRLGGNPLLKVDVRVVSATNMNPDVAVRTGRLRADLYYRLNVIPLEIPPLRERKEDIPLLVDHFVKACCRRLGGLKKRLSADCLEALVRYSWPGNVRELQNLIEGLVCLTEREIVTAQDLPSHILAGEGRPGDVPSSASNGDLALPLHEARKEVLRKFERQYLIELLKSSGGNISKAAQKAMVSRRTLYRMIHMYNLHKYV